METIALEYLQGIEASLSEINDSLATIAAIQQRRERERVTRRLRELERVASMAEARAQRSAEYLELAAEGFDEEYICARAHQSRLDHIAATDAREAVNSYRLIYADVLTLNDVAQPAEVAR